MRSLVAAAVVALVLGAGCSDDGSDDDGSGDRTSPTTFSGDPGSEFCELVRDEESVLDPFEPGLGPDEVEERLGELRDRAAEFAAVAPPELDDVIGGLVEGLAELDEVLAENGYDFVAVAESGVDLSAFDVAGFSVAAEQIAAYRQDVCLS